MTKAEIVQSFRKIPTGNIADAMDDMGLKRQVILGLNPIDPTLPRMVGWAFTLRQAARRADTKHENYTKQILAVDELAQPGDVIVYACNSRTDVCTGGSILALRAQVRGLAGFVVDGCFRDVDEIVALKFPVYLKDTSPIRSKYDIMTYDMQCPVEVCGISVCPGDLIVADPTGIIAIPPDLIEEVLRRSQIIFDSEAQFEDAIRSGVSMQEFSAAAVKR